MTAGPAEAKRSEDLVLALLLAGVTVGGLLWLGGAGYFVLSGRPVPHGRLGRAGGAGPPGRPRAGVGRRRASPCPLLGCVRAVFLVRRGAVARAAHMAGPRPQRTGTTRTSSRGSPPATR